jgi:hypothetical protein
MGDAYNDHFGQVGQLPTDSPPAQPEQKTPQGAQRAVDSERNGITGDEAIKIVHG